MRAGELENVLFCRKPCESSLPARPGVSAETRSHAALRMRAGSPRPRRTSSPAERAGYWRSRWTACTSRRAASSRFAPKRSPRWIDGSVRLAPTQLVDGQQQFFVLVAVLPSRTVTGEAGDEYQRVAADCTADLRAPVLSRPQAGRIRRRSRSAKTGQRRLPFASCHVVSSSWRACPEGGVGNATQEACQARAALTPRRPQGLVIAAHPEPPCPRSASARESIRVAKFNAHDSPHIREICGNEHFRDSHAS